MKRCLLICVILIIVCAVASISLAANPFPGQFMVRLLPAMSDKDCKVGAYAYNGFEIPILPCLTNEDCPQGWHCEEQKAAPDMFYHQTASGQYHRGEGGPYGTFAQMPEGMFRLLVQ